MNKSLFLKPVLAIAGASLLATGCVVGVRGPRVGVAVVAPAPVVVAGEVEVGGAPPAPVVETVTVAPDPAFVWIGGAYIWRGGWVWEPGHWARPPHRGAVWVAHRYVYHNGRHVFVRGYWR
jgi:hypothetical protein